MRRARSALRILVAEDSTAVSELIQEQVLRLGHRVAGVAYSGPEAVALTAEQQPDAVLMDLIMIDPESGREDRFAGQHATEHIMSTSPCPVVWLTAFESSDSTQRAADAGAAGYLVKPADDRDLDRALVLASARFADAQALRRANTELRCEVERRQSAETSLRESELRFRRVFEDSPSGIGLVSGNGLLLEANAALCEMLGTSESELLLRPLAELVYPDDRPHFGLLEHRLRTALLPVVREDIRLQGPARRPLWARSSLRLLSDTAGDEARILAVFENIAERKELEERLKYLSFHDSLTGLYNRTFFEEEVARFGRSRQRPISLVLGDIDGLKATNDGLGHAAGDLLLRHAADVLRLAFRPGDVVARIGGDEFAALLPGTDETAARSVVERLRALIEQHTAGGCFCSLRLSLGAATAIDTSEPLLQALHFADAEMYRDKLARRAPPPSPVR